MWCVCVCVCVCVFTIFKAMLEETILTISFAGMILHYVIVIHVVIIENDRGHHNRLTE